jgi:hypothetical protein
MKKIVTFLPFLAMMALLTGCPYNSKIPLSKPATLIDKSLLGVWSAVIEKGDADSVEMKVYEFNEKEYYIDIKAVSGTKVEIDRYRVFASPIGTTRLLNVEDLEHKGEFNFFRYQLNGNTLKIDMVSDVSVKMPYSSAKAMSKAFAEKISAKDFFENELVFVKK